MTKLQKILLISGSATLLVLSSILIFIDRSVPDAELSTHSRALEYEDTSNENKNNLNVIESNIEENVDEMATDQIDDSKLRAHIEGAMAYVTLNTAHSQPSEQSFFEHAVLYQYVTSLEGDRLSLEEEIEEEARWVAKDLQAWLIVAEEETSFQYDEKEFLSFVDKEGFLAEDDLQTTAILNRLREENENLYKRHLEYHYIKPYIWSQVQIDFQQKQQQKADQTDEEYLYQLYLLFEEKIADYLIENNPELLQE